jgi:hypothetical protein
MLNKIVSSKEKYSQYPVAYKSVIKHRLWEKRLAEEGLGVVEPKKHVPFDERKHSLSDYDFLRDNDNRIEYLDSQIIEHLMNKSEE